MFTKDQVRKIYDNHRANDKTFAECWSSDNHDFYEWCSQYTDYQHKKKKDSFDTIDHLEKRMLLNEQMEDN